MKIIKNYINGSEISISKETISVEDPSKGEKTADVVMSSEDDFKLAIQSAKNIQEEWSNTTPLKRSRILSNYKTLIEKNLDELAELISKEHGKTLSDAKGSVTRGLEVVDLHVELHLLKGEFSQKRN